MSSSVAFCSAPTDIRFNMGSESGLRINVGANTIARFSDDIMFFDFFSVTLKLLSFPSTNDVKLLVFSFTAPFVHVLANT